MKTPKLVVEFVDGESADSSDLAKSLCVLLADSVVLWLRSAGCHWNTEGAGFPANHAFFGTIVDEIYATVDIIAEHLRKLGVYAPMTLSAMERYRSIEDATLADTHVDTFIADLIIGNDALLADIAEVRALAKNEPGLDNYMADLHDMCQKRRWFLTSTLK